MPSPALAEMLFCDTGWRQSRQNEAAKGQTLAEYALAQLTAVTVPEHRFGS